MAILSQVLAEDLGQMVSNIAFKPHKKKTQ